MLIFTGIFILTKNYANSTDKIVKETAKSIKIPQDIAAVNIRPILNIVPTKINAREKGIRLINYGLGSAIINNINFKKNNIKTKDISVFFNLSATIKFDSQYLFPNSNSYIRLGEEKNYLANR